MLDALQRALSIPELRQRLLFVLGMLAVFAVGAHVPVPGVDPRALADLIQRGGLLGFVDVFSGGALRRLSVFAMGIGPYINASIIMQLMTIAIPKLEQLQKEGEAGRKEIARYTRWLTIVLAIFQAFMLTQMFVQGNIQLDLLTRLHIMIVFVAGSMFLLWMGEQITQKGVGNGISMMIFAGILLSLPAQVGQMIEQVRTGAASPLNLAIFVAFFISTVYAIVYITQGARRIPIQHTKRVVGARQVAAGTSYLPVKVNSAGVIPIIFAVSLLMFPATIAGFIPGDTGFVGSVKYFANNIQPGASWWGTATYALLIAVFTLFYTSIVMNVEEMADNLKKYGNYIPSIRPGKPTYEYLDRVISRITLAGALFLAVIAVIQYIVPSLTGFTSFQLIGGTSLLIVVSVAIETMQAIEAQLLIRNYEGFIKPSATSNTDSAA